MGCLFIIRQAVLVFDRLAQAPVTGGPHYQCCCWIGLIKRIFWNFMGNDLSVVWNCNWIHYCMQPDVIKRRRERTRDDVTPRRPAEAYKECKLEFNHHPAVACSERATWLCRICSKGDFTTLCRTPQNFVCDPCDYWIRSRCPCEGVSPELLQRVGYSWAKPFHSSASCSEEEEEIVTTSEEEKESSDGGAPDFAA